VFCRHDILRKKTAVICVDLRYGLPNRANVTEQQLVLALDDGGMEMIERNPLWVNIAYISMAVHSWKVIFEFVASELNICVSSSSRSIVEDLGNAEYADSITTPRRTKSRSG
jgi:hypothetical protein